MKENWDSSVGALYDGGPCTTNGSGKCDVHAQDGNGLAILSGATNNSYAASLVSDGVTPEESILHFMTSALSRPYGNAFYDKSTLSLSDQFDQRVYAFISYFELAARFQTSQTLRRGTTTSSSAAADGMAESAFEELRRLFGHMARHDPASTFWEGIGPGGGYYEEGYTSLAHGWSTCIVPLMQNYVLGVTPTGAGLTTFDVRPVTTGGGLSFARGVVPMPASAAAAAGSGQQQQQRGITVEWTVEDAGVGGGRGLRLTVGVPEGAVGTVYVPVPSGDGTVMLDGATVWTEVGGVAEGHAGAVRFEDGYVVVGVEAGSTHVFATTA